MKRYHSVWGFLIDRLLNRHTAASIGIIGRADRSFACCCCKPLSSKRRRREHGVLSVRMDWWALARAARTAGVLVLALGALVALAQQFPEGRKRWK